MMTTAHRALRWGFSMTALLAASGCGGSTAATESADAGALSDASATDVATPDGAGAPDGSPPTPGASVLQHHARATRDGVYVDAKLGRAAVAGLHLDPTFDGALAGPVYAQPLFVDGGPGGRDVLVVATEQNTVYAFDAAGGAVIWRTPPLGAPVPLDALKANPGCGNIDPLGITGTPFIDLVARTIYLDAMTTPDGGATKRHLVFALSLDDGSVREGWPVDLDAALAGAPLPFDSRLQNQRGALLVQGGTLYVPFGGHDGDCGPYHGWVIGIDTTTRAVTAWATPGEKGGIWAPNGVSSDGTSIFATSGNTAGVSTWAGGEAVLRFAPGPVFSGAPADYFAPANWKQLDAADLDLGGAAALIVDLPGATPSALVVAMGKDGKVYLADRGRLGGVGGQLFQSHVATNEINAAPTTWRTADGAWLAFRVAGQGGGTGTTCTNGAGGNLVALRIVAGAPPSVAPAWCAPERDLSSPITTMTDVAGSDALVWAMSASRLHAFDAATGDEVLAGGGPGDAMSNVQYFQAPIVAKGRVYVAGASRLYAFTP